ncbi:MAG TPA: hypothetical protein VGD40_13950 [Chryseosolibacter sp.]
MRRIPINLEELIMRYLAIVLIVAPVTAFAQAELQVRSHAVQDTLYATTSPVEGLRSFQKRLEISLSGADTLGRKHRIRLDNIGFIVSKTGQIDSAWIIFARKPLYAQVIRILKQTEWIPAQQGEAKIPSHQELVMSIYLTKGALKKHRTWPSFAQRVLPWAH